MDPSILPRSGKAVLITGTSTGIGRACALSLARRGYLVFAGVRTPLQGDLLRREGYRRVVPLRLDIRESSQIQDACQEVRNALGPSKGLHGLINNAGITLPGPVEHLPLAELRRIFEVNVLGHLAVIQAFLPLIRGSRGRIIIMGSALGRLAMPLSGGYAATKFALEALADSLRRELRPSGIHVCLFQPGSVRSAIWEKISSQANEVHSSLPSEARTQYASLSRAVQRIWQEAESSALSPQAVCRAMFHALESHRPKTRYPIGHEARLLSLLSRWVPDRVMDAGLTLYLGRRAR